MSRVTVNAKASRKPAFPQLREAARYKAFEKVMRQVYANLPDHVFNDMYSQEKQYENIVDPDIGSQLQTLTNDVLQGKPGALEKFRAFERQRESIWIDTRWTRNSQSINLHWNDLSEKKRKFFSDKYTGHLKHFPARTKDKHGYLDKLERLVASFTEPVILLQDTTGFDVVGGNNRVFTAFFAAAMQTLPAANVEQLPSILIWLNKANPSVKLLAYIGHVG